METVIRQRSGTWFIAGVVATLVLGLVATQAWRVGAAPGDEETNLVPIAPCRLVDTRPGADRVGTAGTMSVQDTKTFQATGDNGQCADIPAEAVGVSLNVTALRATARTFITIWPSGELPNASSLNPDVGQPPVPNAVTTKLSDSGSFQVYNDVGSVDLIIDINGYLLPSSEVTDFEVVEANFPVSMTASGDAEGRSVECPPGKMAIGGGASVVPSGTSRIYLESSVPFSKMLGWYARAAAETAGATGTLNIYAVCASGVVLAP